MIRTTVSACSVLLVTILLLPVDAIAQSIEGELEGLAVDNAQLYMHPIATGFGVSLGSGFAETARTHGTLGFDLGVRVMGAFVPDADRSFVPVLPTSVIFQDIQYLSPYGVQGGGAGLTPTAAGEGSGVILAPQDTYRDAILDAGQDPDDYNVPFPEGLDLSAVPFALIQGSVGIGFGTDVIARVIPPYEVNSEVGKVSALGFGVKHSIDQWLPALFPVDLAALAGWQTFEVGDYLEARAVTTALIASKGLGPLTIYGTGGYDRSTVDVTYTVQNAALMEDGTTFEFTYESRRGFRGALGLGLQLLLLDLSAEYAVGAYNTASVKAGISFN